MTIRITVDEAAALADERFAESYNCAQSSLLGLQAALGIEDESLWLAAAGFGGGVGRTQQLCGAISGGVLAIGVATARELRAGRADRVALRDLTYARVQELLRRFQDRFGATDCRTLTGHDFAAPDGYQAFAASGQKNAVCHPAVRFVVETAADICGKN